MKFDIAFPKKKSYLSTLNKVYKKKILRIQNYKLMQVVCHFSAPNVYVIIVN